MSTKHYVSGTALLLLILCSIASATLVNDTRTYTGRQKIHELWPLDRTLEVGPTGNVSFSARVDMDGSEGVPCQIIMSGGILNIPDAANGLEMSDSRGPCRLYINKGTMTAGRISNWGTTRDDKIYIGGGTLIVGTNYDPNGAGDIENPAYWISKGSMEALPTYELVLQAPAPGGPTGSVKIYGKRSASNPDPADDDTIVNINLPSLCWDSYDTKIYKVYFGTADANESNYAANLAYLGKSAVVADPNILTNLCYSLTGQLPLSAPESYTWALAAYSSVVGGEPNGPVRDVKVYQFNVSDVPFVKVQPISTGYWASEEAVLTTVVRSYTAPSSYNWYKTTAPTVPIAGTMESLGNFEYRLKLSYPTVIGNQGRYFCTVVNGAGSVNTDEANLVAKAEMAHWTFNGNLLDSAPKDVNPTVYNGTAAVTASYVESSGSDPNALDFDGSSQYVTLPSGFGNFRAGMTIAAYFRMDNTGNTNARLIEFGNSDPTQSVYLAHRKDTADELTFFTGGTRGTEGEEGLRLNRVFEKGAWSHVVVTMDNAGNVVCYKNGFPVAGATGTVAVPEQIARDNTRIGWDRAGLVAKLNGRIGDLRVYNYAISADDVADRYAELVGWFCRDAQDYDWNSDCTVDFADFVSIAKAWQDCGIYPASACP